MRSIVDFANELKDYFATKQALTNQKVLEITTPSFSTLPQTYTSSNVAAIANVTADHIVLNSAFSNSAAQISDWTITTGANSITIAGSISGSTDLKLLLGIKR